jgi:hypothetical protein
MILHLRGPLQEALDIAQEVYPTTLGLVQRHLISFSVPMRNELGEDVPVRVTRTAWAPYMAMMRYCIFVDIAVTSDGEEKGGGLTTTPVPKADAEMDGHSAGEFVHQKRHGFSVGRLGCVNQKGRGWKFWA